MDYENHRTIIIATEQLRIIKELIDKSDLSYYPPEIKEEIELLSGMIEDTINDENDITHGFIY